MPAKKTVRSYLVRLLYRLISPKHPRGWIELDWEEMPDGSMRLFSEGLDTFDLPEIEILDCPADQVLLGYCHGIMFVVIGALQLSQKKGRPISDGETVDLRVNEDEEQAVVRLVSVGRGVYRLEDLDPGPNSFPSCAVATYILNAADNMRPLKALEAADLAAEVHAKQFSFEEVRPSEDDFHTALSRSNARAYYLIGDALVALNREDDALEAIEEGVARAPFMAERIKADLVEQADLGPIENYLKSVDPWQVQERFRLSRSS